MSIDVSQIIWTVICFGLFALVLDRLLFKPVLKLLDERRERIENARVLKEKTAERKLMAEEAERKRLEEALESEREERELLMERERRAMEAEIEAVSRDIEAGRARKKEAEETLRDEIGGRLDSSMEELMAAFATRLVSGGQK